MLLDKLDGEGGIESVTGPRKGDDGGEGSGGVDTEGGKGTFWSLEIVESVVDDDGDGSCMLRDVVWSKKQMEALLYREVSVFTSLCNKLA